MYFSANVQSQLVIVFQKKYHLFGSEIIYILYQIIDATRVMQSYANFRQLSRIERSVIAY